MIVTVAIAVFLTQAASLASQTQSANMGQNSHLPPVVPHSLKDRRKTLINRPIHAEKQGVDSFADASPGDSVRSTERSSSFATLPHSSPSLFPLDSFLPSPSHAQPLTNPLRPSPLPFGPRRSPSPFLLSPVSSALSRSLPPLMNLTIAGSPLPSSSTLDHGSREEQASPSMISPLLHSNHSLSITSPTDSNSFSLKSDSGDEDHQSHSEILSIKRHDSLKTSPQRVFQSKFLNALKDLLKRHRTKEIPTDLDDSTLYAHVSSYLDCILIQLQNDSNNFSSCPGNTIIKAKTEECETMNGEEPSGPAKLVRLKLFVGKGQYKKVNLGFAYDSKAHQPLELLAYYKVIRPIQSNLAHPKESAPFIENNLLDEICRLSPDWKLYRGKDPRSFAQPFVAGGPLSDLLDTKNQKREPDLKFSDVLNRFGISLLRNLKLLHDHDILHLDIKPENILRKEPQEIGPEELVLTDFDTARKGPEAVSEHDLGTPSYIDPKSLRTHGTYTKASDIWSAGMTLFNIATRGRLNTCLSGNLKNILQRVEAIETYEQLCENCGVCMKTYGDSRETDHTADENNPITEAEQLAEQIIFEMLNPNPEKRLTVDEGLQKISELKN